MIKRLPWLRNLKKTDIDPPLRLPIAAGSITNGEGWWPDTKRKQLIRKLVLERADEMARKHNVDRREFLASSCGMATTLFMINMVNGCSSGGKKGPSGSLNGTNPAMNGPMPGVGPTGGPMAGPGPTGGPMAGPGPTGGPMTGPTGMPNQPVIKRDGGFSVPEPMYGGDGGMLEQACFDPELADMMMGGNELVIDMQSHFATPETNPLGAALLGGFIGQINVQRYPWLVRSPGVSGAGRYDRMEYIAQILVGSPTTIGVLSGISYAVGTDGTGAAGGAVLTNEDLLGGADYLNTQYPGRILKHCMVMPNDRIEVQLKMMERNASSYHNWKTYPPYQGNVGTGYWLDQGVGPMMIQKGIDLGLPIFCVHKGFPLSGFSAEHCSPRDVGPAARMFPGAVFVIYHSGFENGLSAGESSAPSAMWLGEDCGGGQLMGGTWPEGPYDENDEQVQALYPLNRGVNSLIKSLRDSNIGPNGRDLDNPSGPVTTQVYAECGGVWPALMTSRNEEAQHYWGKLLKHVGEDRIVWGTDCLWFGSPAPLIQAFRCFQISKEFQDRYGYPELTQERKEKILGRNAARLQNTHPDVNIQGCHSDIVGDAHLRMQRELDEEFGPRRDMMFDVIGPKSRREFLALTRNENREKSRWSGNVPAVQPTRRRV